MKSPFPGMDPYLERHWGDVHATLIPYARNLLRPQLPGDLRARIEERVYIEVPGEVRASIIPDVTVMEASRRKVSRRRNGSAGSNGNLALAEPILVPAEEEITEIFIDIRDRSDGDRVVTTIEFVSPKNKLPGKGRRAYQTKQRRCLAAGINLVEIDLIRRGKHVLAYPVEKLPPEQRKTYAVCVRPAADPDTASVYPISLRERLPTIAVPLRPGDSEVGLNLQRLIERVYQAGDYDETDYDVTLEPPLAPADAKWADALLRKKGLR